MGKTGMFVLCVLVILMFSWCATQDQIDDLESEVNNLKEIIDSCNSNIEDAQSYARSTYDDMWYALDNLTSCEY